MWSVGHVVCTQLAGRLQPQLAPLLVRENVAMHNTYMHSHCTVTLHDKGI